MIRIPPPEWARPFERSVEPGFEALELDRILQQHDLVLLAAHEAVQGYIDDALKTSEADRIGFPNRARLTGEYYIHSEDFWVNDEPWFPRVGRHREYCFSVFACCLERLVRPRQQDQDYLGLQVRFAWLPQEGHFVFTGDVDTSSI